MSVWGGICVSVMCTYVWFMCVENTHICAGEYSPACLQRPQGGTNVLLYCTLPYSFETGSLITSPANLVVSRL